MVCCFWTNCRAFQRNVLEVMRQSLEDGSVTIARAAVSVTFPSRFMLAAAMNPCPCGYFGDPTRECHRTPPMIQRYVSKTSGPLLDRIDIQIEVPSVKYKELRAPAASEDSAVVRTRVIEARELQHKRFTAEKNTSSNVQMAPKMIRKHRAISADGEKLLENAVSRLGLSARAHDRNLKVSRTIADLDGSESIEPKHLCEAIQYRTLDRSYWA
jgi:magnesium chelatase family protein